MHNRLVEQPGNRAGKGGRPAVRSTFGERRLRTVGGSPGGAARNPGTLETGTAASEASARTGAGTDGRENAGRGSRGPRRMAESDGECSHPKGGPVRIVIIAQNHVWLAGLQSVCRTFGQSVAWTAEDWRARGGRLAAADAPALVVHHWDDGHPALRSEAGEDREDLKRRWPTARFLTISDASAVELPPAGVQLSQSCSILALKRTIQALLAGV